MYACEIGDKRIIELFIKNGAEVDFPTISKLTARDILIQHHPHMPDWFDKLTGEHI
jgi:hypothetical protein